MMRRLLVAVGPPLPESGQFRGILLDITKSGYERFGVKHPRREPLQSAAQRPSRVQFQNKNREAVMPALVRGLIVVVLFGTVAPTAARANQFMRPTNVLQGRLFK